MATLSYKVFEKEFKNEVSKKAYLECCKWIGDKILKKKEISENLTYRIIKKSDTKIPTFVISVFLHVDEEKTKKDFCDKCKHLYNTFYQLDRMNCSECRMRAYRQNVEDYTKGLINIYESIFKEEDNEK